MLAGHRLAHTVVRSQVEDEVTLLFKRFAAELTDEHLKTYNSQSHYLVFRALANITDDEREEGAEDYETLLIYNNLFDTQLCHKGSERIYSADMEDIRKSLEKNNRNKITKL